MILGAAALLLAIHIPPDVHIVLHRGPCFGLCAARTLRIDRDGTVKFRAGVGEIVGNYTGHIDRRAMSHIMQAADQANYFDAALRKNRGCSRDGPDDKLTIGFGGRERTILDGRAFGHPERGVTLHVIVVP